MPETSETPEPPEPPDTHDKRIEEICIYIYIYTQNGALHNNLGGVYRARWHNHSEGVGPPLNDCAARPCTPPTSLAVDGIN